nr:sigma-70 family RNA polymerase sigma factor [Novosphingobium resinovorum]
MYRSQKRGLLRFVARKGRREDAEDVVQQVFVRVAGTIDPSGIAAPGEYLRQAASNVLRDHARAIQRRGGEGHVPIEDALVAGSDPIAMLEARDRLARLEEAVLRLKPLARQIFLARRLDGYTYAEIAQQTGLSVRGVEKQMNRALKLLNRHLLCDD